MSRCGICSAENLDKLETLGLEAENGVRSWRSAAIEAGLTHHQGLKNHMERHFVAKAQQALSEAADDSIAETLAELKEAMRRAPVDIKPLYAVAIHNLAELKNTKPSQDHLIRALKTIHEITGMKLERALLLDYAKTFQALPVQQVPLELNDGIQDAEVVGEE